MAKNRMFKDCITIPDEKKINLIWEIARLLSWRMKNNEL